MKRILIFLLVLVGLFGLYKLISIKPDTVQQNYDNPDLVLYWGVGCSHCEVVKDFITNNSVDQKLKINQKEVFNDNQNQQEFENTIKNYCPELNNGQGIGVPVIFDTNDKKCVQGDQPIIDLITQKMGQNNK